MAQPKLELPVFSLVKSWNETASYRFRSLRLIRDFPCMTVQEELFKFLITMVLWSGNFLLGGDISSGHTSLLRFCFCLSESFGCCCAVWYYNPRMTTLLTVHKTWNHGFCVLLDTWCWDPCGTYWTIFEASLQFNNAIQLCSGVFLFLCKAYFSLIFFSTFPSFSIWGMLEFVTPDQSVVEVSCIALLSQRPAQFDPTVVLELKFGLTKGLSMSDLSSIASS